MSIKKIKLKYVDGQYITRVSEVDVPWVLYLSINSLFSKKHTPFTPVKPMPIDLLYMPISQLTH